MQKNTFVHYVAKLTVDILFFGGSAFLLCIPLWSKPVMKSYGYTGVTGLSVMILIFLAGLCSIYILFNLKRMFKTLLGENPFVRENVCELRKIAVACALISVIFFVKAVLIFSIGTLLAIIIFAIGCLFCLTLKDLFKQAITYKEENDWTV